MAEERKAAEAETLRARHEIEAAQRKLATEKAEVERLAGEHHAREEAARAHKARLERERWEREQFETMRPDAEKIHAYGRWIRAAEPPSVENPAAREFLDAARTQLMTLADLLEMFCKPQAPSEAAE